MCVPKRMCMELWFCLSAVKPDFSFLVLWQVFVWFLWTSGLKSCIVLSWLSKFFVNASILIVSGLSTETEVRYFANSWEPFQGIPSGALLIPQPSQSHGCGVSLYLGGWVKSVFPLEIPREQKWKQKMVMIHISLLGHESFVTAFFN